MQAEEVFDFLVRLADSVADTFGKSCETVIHEIINNSTQILYVRNGAVTGRKVGDRKSLLGDESLIKNVYAGKDLVNYKAVTMDGKLIKSTTIHFKGDNYHYAFGINFDYTVLSMVNKPIADLISTGLEYEKILTSGDEVNIDEIFNDCIDMIGIPAAFMKKDDKLKLVGMLEQKAAFTIRGSVPQIAEKLGISRYTIYNYLREVRGSENK